MEKLRNLIRNHLENDGRIISTWMIVTEEFAMEASKKTPVVEVCSWENHTKMLEKTGVRLVAWKSCVNGGFSSIRCLTTPEWSRFR
jgi:hypothetical protein